MAHKRIAGAGAGVLKYDILTALTIWGLRGSPVEQTSALRLVAVITARYNWTRDDVSIGQGDLARMWGVSDRTAKREVRRWLDWGLMRVVQAGVRGRVARYRLDRPRVMELSQDHWASIGPDFAHRFGADPDPIPRAAPPHIAIPADMSPFQDCLRAKAPAAFSAWLAKIEVGDVSGDRVHLSVPSAFIHSYVVTHYGDVLDAAVAETFGRGKRASLFVAA